MVYEGVMKWTFYNMSSTMECGRKEGSQQMAYKPHYYNYCTLANWMEQLYIHKGAVHLGGTRNLQHITEGVEGNRGGSRRHWMGKSRIWPARRSAKHFSCKRCMSVCEKQSKPPLTESRSMKTMTKTPQSWPLHGQTWRSSEISQYVVHNVPFIVV